MLLEISVRLTLRVGRRERARAARAGNTPGVGVRQVPRHLPCDCDCAPSEPTKTETKPQRKDGQDTRPLKARRDEKEDGEGTERYETR